ncbi:MAG: hypothetical protein ACOC5K_01380 [Chloroflexota bacterium]
MLTYSLRSKIVMAALVFALAAVSAAGVSAHEQRDAAGYSWVVGFAEEPAFEGEPNGVSVRISDPSSGDDAAPVEGLADTLQVEVTHIPTGDSRTMDLGAVFNDPGQYVADFIPTAPGAYRFHFTGSIEGTEVDEVFESGPDTFDVVTGAEEVQFPFEVASGRELQGAVEGVRGTALGAEEAALEADQNASTARTLSIVAIIVGVLGLIGGAGAGFLAASRRNR